MAETTESQATTSDDNTHWGIAYLRERPARHTPADARRQQRVTPADCRDK